MFKLKEVLDAIKDQVANDPIDGLTHCQMLNAKAHELGFQNYHHLRESLRNIPNDEFGPVSLGLMRRLCQSRLPSLDCPYYELHAHPNGRGGIGFYSRWAGWDKYGEEVRVPRPLDGRATVPALRKTADHPIYVIEAETELWAWKFRWGATAYVPESLAKHSFGSIFRTEGRVEENPPIDLVKAKSEERMARLYAQIKKAK